jgi:hypothetical protein
VEEEEDFSRELRDKWGPNHSLVRYNDVRITSDTIKVKWDDETKILTVKGAYGI